MGRRSSSGRGIGPLCSLLVLLGAACETPTPPALPPLIDRQSDNEFDAGSRIADQPLSPMQVENLALLGEVWGFVKYHHLLIKIGQVNWDYELFRIMPAVLEAQDRAAAAARLSEWLARLGDPAPCTSCTLPTNLHLSPPVEWIRDRTRLGEDLSDRLSRIYAGRTGTEQFYVSQVPSVGNPEFVGEALYSHLTTPDAGYRLLALFRFWNIIRYWFPYRDLIEEDWWGVLVEFVPRLMAASTPEAYRLELLLLIGRIHDSHAGFGATARPGSGALKAPVVLRFVEGRAVVSGYSHASLGPATGLELGDVIETIDGKPVETLVAEWWPYYGGSNEAARRSDIAWNLLRGDGGTVSLGIRRGTAAFERTVERIQLSQLDPRVGTTHDLPGDAFQMLSDEVAYLKLSSVVSASSADYVRRAAGAKVLVIDIRNYPNQFVVFTLGRYLVNGPVPFARFTVGDLRNPGAFVWGQPVGHITAPEPRFNGAVVILVDEVTVSQAEYTAMAFRVAPRAMVVGSTTTGADGNVSRIPLPGGLYTAMSGIGVFYPNNTPTQRVGIVPDLVVRPTIAGIRAGRDEVLEAGVSRALGRDFRLGVP